MAEQLQDVQEKSETIVTRALGLGRKTFLAGVGFVGIIQDEVVKGWENSNEFAERCVERGEEMSEERRQQLSERTEKRQEQVGDFWNEFGERVNGAYINTTEAVLTRVNVPTRNDIQQLSKQIDALSRKIDRVRKEQKEIAAA
ncbi:MAG: phasin family protein [Candidatus Promineifilaceae bacterium]|nr:phasin family protein [Candidatus Promineifilaceae bacterium]